MVSSKDINKIAEGVTQATPNEVQDLLTDIKSILKAEPRLIRLPNRPLIFIGDTHGDWEATKAVLLKYWDKTTTFVFLGDYVDRGPNQIENINFLYEMKKKAPNQVVLLRGNHEIPSINRYYGFFNEVERSFGNLHENYWKTFAELPLAAYSVQRRILGLHGGVPEGLHQIEEINQLPREVEPEHPIVNQILWNDPKETLVGFASSMRGGRARVFGRDVTERFMKENNVELIVRAHEVFPHGYYTFFDGLIMSLFSCRNYRGPIAGKALLVKTTGERELIPI